MNLNDLSVHKSTPFLSVYNSFLKIFTLQYFSAVVRAVPPEEIGRGSFATVSFLSVWLVLSLSEKANCDVSPCLRLTFTLHVKASFYSTCPTWITLVVLIENWINRESSAVISLVSLVLGVSNKSSNFSLEYFNQIHLKKKLIFCSILLLFFISIIF